MKSTGIIRRVDDLGRIVIPKELRKNLKILDNECLEIFLDADNIILKKVSSFDDLGKVLKLYIKNFEEVLNKNIFVTDRTKIICTSDLKEFDYLNKDIGITVHNSIKNRKSIISNDMSNLELKDNENMLINYYICPILKDGDVFGSIVVTSTNYIKDIDKTIIELLLKLICNYL